MPAIYEKLKALTEAKSEEIESWFAEYSSAVPSMFYSSVDIRHSGYKIAPVDTNLFPAGFNLLTPNAIKRAQTQVKLYFEQFFPEAKNIILIPENHTRNLFYLENVTIIKELLEQAGKNVRLGGLSVQNETVRLESKTGKELFIEPLIKKDEFLQTGGDKPFKPDLIIINNDLTAGIPEILQGIKQEIIPPVNLGWHKRRKTIHFEAYENLIQSFCAKFDVDPWLISTNFHRCQDINFKEKTGLDCVANAVDKVLGKLQKKYHEYNVDHEPYVFIKADSGTYGMGIMIVRSAGELYEMNKKSRNKMNIIKEGAKNTKVIIQEGIPTIDSIGGKVAEPLVYLIAGKPVGCTYRVNENRDKFSNLNSEGMFFESACDEDSEKPSEVGKSMCPVQGLIARIASLAATQECYDSNWEI